MDLSFARRRKALLKSDTPDLLVLLAGISAKQAASRTALANTRIHVQTSVAIADPLIEIFAPVGHPVVATCSFSDQVSNPVNPRKLT